MDLSCPLCGASLDEPSPEGPEPVERECPACGARLAVRRLDEHGPADAAGTVFQPRVLLEAPREPGAARAPDLPERIGRYRIIRELGRGSMGRVYLARDPHTDRDVALKIVAETAELPPEAAEEARARFLLEARAAGRLSHPGIVLVYDADVDPKTGCPFLAMELVAGRPLTELLRERGRLTVREAAGIAAEIADALDHAHARGIIHRDVKPGNVLITDAGRVKITDFGVAKIADESHTRTGAVLGTPNYISPEQLRGDPLDGRADLFALGALLYEMLTGDPPFRSDSLAGITHKIVFVDPRPPTFHRPEIPARLEDAVLRALAKQPGERFASAREMAQALRDVIDDAPASRPPSETTLRLSRPTVPAGPEVPRLLSPGFRTALRAGVVVLIVLGALGGGRWLSSRRATPSAPAEAPRGREAGEAVARPAATAPSSGPREQEATLELLFYNRLRNGTMTVWVDGRKAWSTTLNVHKDPLRFVTGEPVRATIPLASGARTIEVRIAQSKARIDSSGVIRARFEPGQRRRLRVVLVPYLPTLELELDS